MRVSRWLLVVLGLCVAVTSVGTMGCAGLLGDFTTDENGDGGIDSSVVTVADANGGSDGTVSTGDDANGTTDGTVSDTNNGDAPPSEDAPQSNDAADSGPGACGVLQKDCSGTCRSTTDPLFGCADPNSCAPCNLPHATAECTGGACAIAACTPSFTDCNGLASDGCEVLGKCPCTSSNCAGCCDQSGTCQTSGMSTCGIHGASCTTCVAGQACNSAGGCDCDPACTTCCSNHVCAGESDTTCGSGGIACTGCSDGTTCALNGSNGYQCQCTSSSCATGCCTLTPGGGTQASTCTKTELPAACGLHGAMCVTCGTDVACDATAGACKCTASSCGTGCCTTDTSGNPECELQPAQSTGSCGNGGNTCAPCTAANTCSAGVCSCPPTAAVCGGVCTDLQTNAQNCGTCGHSCLDETCVNGQCQQVTLASLTGQGQGIAVSGAAIDFTISEGGQATGTVQQITLPLGTTCAPNCSTKVIGALDYPTGVLIAGSATSPDVYVDQSGTGALQLLTSGGTVTTVATGAGPEGYGTGIIADSGHVYYANAAGVSSCPIGSSCAGVGGGTPVAPNSTFATYMAVDDNSVLYFSDFAADVYRCPLPSCVGTGPTKLVSTGTATTFLYVDSTSIFWIDRETDNCDCHITRSNKSTGAVLTTYSTSVCGAQGIRADANKVYWGAQDGVYSCPLAGCGTTSPTKIGTAGTTDAIDQDAAYVYWVDYGGSVYRVAK